MCWWCSPGLSSGWKLRFLFATSVCRVSCVRSFSSPLSFYLSSFVSSSSLSGVACRLRADWHPIHRASTTLPRTLSNSGASPLPEGYPSSQLLLGAKKRKNKHFLFLWLFFVLSKQAMHAEMFVGPVCACCRHTFWVLSFEMHEL